MAKIKLSPFLTDIRGSLAPAMTFQKRGDGHYLVKKPHPIDKQSTAQLEQRTKFLDARDAWLALPPEDKAQWNEDARVGTNMTGYAYFIQQTINAPQGLPRQDIMIDRWVASENAIQTGGTDNAVDGESVGEWGGLLGNHTFEITSFSYAPRWQASTSDNPAGLRFQYDYMRCQTFDLPNPTAARTVAILASADFQGSDDGLFNWAFSNTYLRGCAVLGRGGLDFNAGVVPFDFSPITAGTLALHVVSAPEGANTDEYEYTLDGVTYNNTDSNGYTVNTLTYQGLVLGFGDGTYLYGNIYAVAVWDGYLNASERERITRELLLEVP